MRSGRRTMKTNQHCCQFDGLETDLQLYRPALESSAAGAAARSAPCVRRSASPIEIQLAQRVGRQPRTVLDLERREVARTIQLDSLRDLADAIDCELVVRQVVPRQPLEDDAERGVRRSVARNALRRTGRSMEGLERQGLGVARAGASARARGRAAARGQSPQALAMKRPESAEPQRPSIRIRRGRSSRRTSQPSPPARRRGSTTTSSKASDGRSRVAARICWPKAS